MHTIGLQGVFVFQRIAGVHRFLHVALIERVGVDNQRTSTLQVRDICLQSRGIHCDKRVDLISGGEDVVIRKAQLISRDTRERSSRRPDFGGEVGQRADIVTERRRDIRQLSPTTTVSSDSF